MTVRFHVSIPSLSVRATASQYFVSDVVPPLHAYSVVSTTIRRAADRTLSITILWDPRLGRVARSTNRTITVWSSTARGDAGSPDSKSMTPLCARPAAS